MYVRFRHVLLYIRDFLMGELTWLRIFFGTGGYYNAVLVDSGSKLAVL